MKKVRSLFIILVLLLSSINLYSEPDILAIPLVSPEEMICFALYTVQNNILKLTAQMYPLQNAESKIVRLEIKKDGDWKEIAKTEIVYPGFTAPFRVENWDVSKDYEYRVAHGKSAYYEGIIKKDPVEKETIVVAAFTGNSIYKPHGGDIPRDDIVENLKKIKPDLLFFSGDQVYNHSRHLAYWLKFGREFGEIIRITPTICIPDDHDVGHFNLWGASGKKSISRAGNDGGYYMPAEYVKEVERAQTSHLPDPYDPTPVEQGIGVYYTSMNVGGIDFAIIEDRKFKSGPEGLVPKQGPRPDHITDPNYDPASVDVPGAILLGDRQIKFLNEWGQDWRNVKMKAVLSATIFCGGAHVHGKVGGRVHADMDSNGWPQTGRNRALAEIRKFYGFMIAGDQHLATIFHHGINDWNDAGYSFCVPSIANLYLRWWEPLEKGQNTIKGMPSYTGEYYDGFKNKVTCYAAANPTKEPNGGSKLTTRAAGYGIVKFNKKTRDITMECWPRNVDITNPKTKQYIGWPKTINQLDNYGRKAVAYLPELTISGTNEPVIQIIEEKTNKVVYTIRVNENTFHPKVFTKGKYTIKVGDPENDKWKILKNIKPSKKKLKIKL